MTDPFMFESVSPRFGLPLLFAAQAQKEAFVNEAHALIDALLHCAIEGRSAMPPSTSVDGESWIVGDGATGAWQGRDGSLAFRQSGNWLFVSPQDGMRVLDRSSGQEMRYFGGWQIPNAPLEPTGGLTVDSEARHAINELIAALRASGVFNGT